MNVHLPLLLLAIALLWFPRQWLRLGATLLTRRRRRPPGRGQEPWNTREPGDPRVNTRKEFGRFRNYVDLLRGAAGALLLSGGFGFASCLQAAPGASRTIFYQVLALRAAILLVGLLIQTLRWNKERLTFFPPIFYLAGLSFGMLKPWAALAAFLLIWAFNAGIGNAQGFLTIYAILMMVFGSVFAGGRDNSAMYVSFLCFLPVLLSLLCNRPLVVLSRKATHGAAG
jgi:hypothetical protein